MKLNALGYNGPDAVNRFYNNLSWEKRKYPMFEHNHVPQSAIDNSSEYLSRTSSEVFFNTLYRSRKAAASKDPYVGVLVDVYGPDVTIKHNLVIEPEADAPFDPARNYVFQLGAGSQPGVVAENNLVFPTLAAAGLADASSFTPTAASPAKDAATGRVAYITQDYNGRERYAGCAADVGAVEHQEAAPPTFAGAKTQWHGFDRYDFLLDEESLAIKAADPAIKGNVPGQRRCIVVAPQAAWAIEHPDKVSCIYAENPVLRCKMSKILPL